MKNEAIVRKMIAYIQKVLGYCEEVIYADFVEEHSEIPWKQMRGLRNKIVHDYEGVNLILVWEIITNDLPELLQQLKMII